MTAATARGRGGGYGVVAFYSSAPERDSAVPCFSQVTAERTKYSSTRKKHHSHGYNIYVVVKFHFLMFETHYHKQERMSYIIIPKKQKKKIQPGTKLNHNVNYTPRLAYFVFSNLSPGKVVDNS